MKSNLSKEFMDLSLTMLICILKILINIMKTFFRVIIINYFIVKYGTWLIWNAIFIHNNILEIRGEIDPESVKSKSSLSL